MSDLAMRRIPTLCSRVARSINVIAGALFAAFVVALAPREGLAQISLNFDGTGAPCEFGDTSPLTTQYAAQGITFAGTGAVLNQCSNFIVGARSGTDFLAYTTGPGFPPAITDVFTFANPFNQVSLYFANAADFSWRFYLGGTLIGAAGVTGVEENVWNRASFGGMDFDRVEMSTRSSALLIDDLQVGDRVVDPVVTPEPGSVLLVAVGLAVIAGARRRNRVE